MRMVVWFYMRAANTEQWLYMRLTYTSHSRVNIKFSHVHKFESELKSAIHISIQRFTPSYIKIQHLRVSGPLDWRQARGTTFRQIALYACFHFMTSQNGINRELDPGTSQWKPWLTLAPLVPASCSALRTSKPVHLSRRGNPLLSVCFSVYAGQPPS